MVSTSSSSAASSDPLTPYDQPVLSTVAKYFRKVLDRSFETAQHGRWSYPQGMNVSADLVTSATRTGSDEDAAAIALVLGGDSSAFESIVRRWQTPLVNLAWRFCRDRGRAEEMAQEAFLRAFRNLAQFRGDSSFSTWLFSLAANVYRTELRRIPGSPLSLDEIAEPADPRLAATALEGSSRDEAVRRAVLALPARYRDAILLFYFHEQDISAAARTLRIPEGTVKARLFRGRELLRSKFNRPRSTKLRATSESARLAEQRPREVQ